MELQELSQKVQGGIGPTGVFGSLSGNTNEMLEAAKAEFRAFVKKCHPDLVPEGQKEFATQTFKQLKDLYVCVTDQIRTGIYGHPQASPSPASGQTGRSALASISGKLHEYTVYQVIATGEVAKIYKATYVDSNGVTKYVALKIALDSNDNRLITNEQKILNRLAKVLTPQDRFSLPTLIDTFKTRDGKAASALELVDGYDFQQLLDHPLYQNGVKDPYHIGWILERQLALLGHLHKNLIVHGNIEPSHLMLVPHNHNVVLLDFCFAAENPDDADHIHIFTPDYSAPEIESKSPPHPRMDLYGLGKSMVYLLRGDPKTGRLPDDIPRAYVNLINHLIDPDPNKRAGDAWQMAHHLVAIREESGPHQFKPLPI